MYTQSITRTHRTAIILAIDGSGSMAEKIRFRNRQMTKAEAVATITNGMLFELIERARRSDGVRDYYDIAVIGYSGDDEVYSLLPGGRELISVAELAAGEPPIKTEVIEYRLPDGSISLREIPYPAWVEPEAAGQTPMCEALRRVRDIAAAWCADPAHAESFPPMVFNITDGEATAIGGLNGAGIGGGLQKNGEKITVSGDATLKVQGGLTDEWDGAGAGIGNGGRHNGDTGSFIPVNGAETEPDTSNLTTGKIEYYAPGADMTKDEPTSTTFGSLVQPEPSSPGETGAPVEYRMQTSASEPVQGNGKSTGYKAPVQGHFYQVVDQDGKDMIFATAQKKDVLAIATDSDFAMLTGKMVDIEALRKQGVRRIIFATKRATSTFLLSELLEKRAYGETWSLIHDGENVAFTAVEKMMDISSILTRLQTK